MQYFDEPAKFSLANIEKELLELAEKGSMKMHKKSLYELQKLPYSLCSHRQLILLASVGYEEDVNTGPGLAFVTEADLEGIFLKNSYYYISKEKRKKGSTKSLDFLDLVVEGAQKQYCFDITPLFNNSGAIISINTLLKLASKGALNAYDVKLITSAEEAFDTLPTSENKYNENKKVYELLIERYDLAHPDDNVCICTFESLDKAKVAVLAIKERFLEHNFVPGFTSEELSLRYFHRAGNPFISGCWDWGEYGYVLTRCEELCRDEDEVSSILRSPCWPPELSPLKEIIQVIVDWLERENLGASKVKYLGEIMRAIEDYPNAMPQRWTDHLSFSLHQGKIKYEIKLQHTKIKFKTNALPNKVDWKIHFWGSGRRDWREGNLAEALESMRQVALEKEFDLL